MRGSGEASATLVNQYYSLCIPFYREFLGDHWHTGWYADDEPVGPGAQLRMELLVAASAGVGPGSEVLDVGCGVGGPARHIARATGARVRGLTPNADQLAIAQATVAREGLQGQVAFDLGDASRLPHPDAAFDVVLFFESACHFPDRERFFAEAFRVLRPGGCLAGEDWLASDAAGPAARAEWSRRIETTWAIPRLGTLSQYTDQMRSAGFVVTLARDLRDEMPLLRGFLVDPQARREVQDEQRHTPDAMRELIMDGLLVLGDAARLGAFTVGRFVASKPA